MNPFQYQQQQQLQYTQQYGQQQVQFVPAYSYNIQSNQQPAVASGQYGGTFTTALSQQPMVGLYTNVVAEGQFGQSRGSQQVFTPAFAGQTQLNQTYQNAFAGAYQFQQQPAANLQSNDAVGKPSVTAPSSTSFDPPPMNFPSMNVANNSGGQLSIEDINQKYTEQYQKWQQQYNEWQTQHANHPDQKLFQEYQNQVQQWQQQQQQMIQTQGMGIGMQSQAPQATPNQTGQGQQTHSQAVQHSFVNLSSQVPQQTVAHQQFPSMQYQSPSKFTNQGQEPNRIDNQNTIKPNSAVSLKHEERKGPNQWQQNQLHNKQGWPNQGQEPNRIDNQNTIKPNSAVSLKHKEGKGPNQWQQNQQHNNQGWPNQGQEPNRIDNQNYKSNFAVSLKHEEQKGPNQWQQNQQQHNKQGWPNQGQESNRIGNQNYKPNFAASVKHEEKTLSNQRQQTQQHNKQGWSNQNTNIRSSQTSQVSAAKPRPELLKENSVQGGLKKDDKPSQSLPKWMQTQGNQSQQKNKTTEIQASTASTPKWLQSDAKIPAPDQESKKPIPKWLQESNQVKIPEQQEFQENVNKQQNKSAKEPVQPKHTTKDTNPLPKWLQDTKATTLHTPSTKTEAVTTQPTESSQAPQMSLPAAMSTTSSAFSGLLVQKLDPKQELELLQKQSIQLLQLAQLEKKHKESKSVAEVTDSVLKKPIEAEQKPDISTTKIQATSSDNQASQRSSSNQPLIPQTPSEHPVQDIKQGGTTDQSTKDDLQKPQAPSSKLKSVPCRFFPNCRYGAECKFLHPPCKTGRSCTSKDCIFDHSNLPDKVPENDSKVDSFGSFSKKDVQIPGIGDGSHYVKPTADAEERHQPILKDSTPAVEGQNYVPPQVRDEIGRYPEERRGAEPDRWHEDDWKRWRNERDRDYLERDERLIPPREEPPAHWNDRERAFPQNREEWEKSERPRPWRENWGRSPDWVSERDRQPHPSRDEEYRSWYEDERWKSPPDDWDYPPYREDHGRPPLSPRYRREPEFDRERERYPSREMRDRPYYDREFRNEPPRPHDYEQLDRYRRPLSPLPEEYDRRKVWEDRGREYDYWPQSREPDWRDRRDRPFADPQSDRYHEDYERHRRDMPPPTDPSRPPMYDRQRYRDYPPDYDRRDSYWDRRDDDRARDYRDDMHPRWRRNPDIQQDDGRCQDHPPMREPVKHEKPRAVVVPVETILDKPGRDSRPDRIVIILRGLPGSGKTHVARLVKDKEASNGAHAPRIISLDDYFLTEVEKQEKDPDTGKRVKKKVTEYLYEAEMEDSYRASMFKSFSKTLEDGFFPVVMVDAINNKVEHFEKYWSFAKQKGFEVYIAELSADSHVCAKRNSHNRTFEEISKIQSEWEESPTHMLRLDVRSLLQDAVITEVEMETADESTSSDLPKELGKSESNEDNAEEDEQRFKSRIQLPQRSKWDDVDSSAEAQLNKLDGIRPLKRRREASPPLTLSDDEDPYDEKEEDMRIGKKRVRWADLEERKHMEHRRRIGFCIGTDWSLLTDPNAKIPEH